MKYVFQYLYDPANVTLIKEITEWVEENDLQSEIDIFEAPNLLVDYIAFGCKTKEAVVAFKLRWE